MALLLDEMSARGTPKDPLSFVPRIRALAALIETLKLKQRGLARGQFER